MDIPAAEYEARRSAFDLCLWIDGQFKRMEETGAFDRIYWEHEGLNVKRLIEEAVPVSRLALSLHRPGLNVHVTLPPRSEPYDARIEVSGGLFPRSFKVEVTTTETDETTMRRQALSRRGVVNLTGPIKRVGREIEDTGEMVDVGEEEERLADLLFERMDAKVSSGKYDAETAILVYLTVPRALSLDVRADLVHKTVHYLHESENPVAGIYYCYFVGLDVDAVRD